MMFCMLFLKEMNLDDAKIEWEFFQSCPGENGVDNEFFGMSFDDFCKVFVLQTMNQKIFKIVPHSKRTAVEK